MCDLAEVAYVDDYARMGRSARAEMERERRLEYIVRWAGVIFPPLRDAGRGLVWDMDGKIVSAVMYMRVGLSGTRWTIDTVATHPDHQRCGLARRLFARAVESIVQRGGADCSLKVREDNDAAYQLYRSVGFDHYDTTVHLKREERPIHHPAHLDGYYVQPLALKDWYAAWRVRLDLALRETPQAVQRMMPVTEARFRRSRFVRGLAPLVIRVSGISVHHWSIESEGGPVATLTVRGDTTGNRNHEIDLSIDPAHEEALAGPLLDLGLTTLCRYPQANTLVETRAGREALLSALQERAFSVMSTWHWLGLNLAQAKHPQRSEGD